MAIKVELNHNRQPIDVIGLTAAKLQCRVDSDDENELIAQHTASAWDYVERLSWRQFLPATITLTLPCFPRLILLPRPPTTEIKAIDYFDANNDPQTIDVATEIDFDIDEEPVEIRPASNFTWPTTYSRRNAVTITYSAGKGATLKDQNASAMQAVRLMIGEFYENREPARDLLKVVNSLIRIDAIRDKRLADFIR